MKEGITTYRILLQFDDYNPSILSGMSAELRIEKERISNQIVIPRYLVTMENGQTVVTLLSATRTRTVPVTLGQRDNSGNVIITSGVSVGDRIVIPQ